MARRWYAYNGISDPIVITSYEASLFPPSCQNGVRICAIYATGTGAQPAALSSNMRGYIADLQLTLVARPNGTAGVKKYVYGKS